MLAVLLLPNNSPPTGLSKFLCLKEVTVVTSGF